MKRLRKNDEVIVIAGKNKGLSGRILSIDWKKERAIVDKLNMVKKHNKPTQQNPDGGITEKESPIHLSNLSLKDKSFEKGSKVKFEIKDGKKIRIAKKTGKEV